MNNKHIDTSREIRLWLGQIVIPVVAAVFAVSPEAREWARNKVTNMIKHIKSKLSKEK